MIVPAVGWLSVVFVSFFPTGYQVREVAHSPRSWAYPGIHRYGGP